MGRNLLGSRSVVMSAAVYDKLLDNDYDSPVTAVQLKMPRICGPKLSNCCFILSIWGIVMLLILCILFKVQSVALTEDVAHITEKGYNATATNCFIAAGIYGVTFVISFYQRYAISRGYAIVNYFFGTIARCPARNARIKVKSRNSNYKAKT